MSFIRFIYYCAMCGGCAALFGWVFGIFIPQLDDKGVGRAAIQGLLLGMMVAFLLGLLDAMWNAGGQAIGIAMRAITALVVGCVGGFLGGGIGQIFYYNLQGRSEVVALIFVVLGWTITGLLIGAAIGVFDILVRVMSNEDARGAQKKLVNGVLGGTVGGLLGSILYIALGLGLESVFRIENPWTPGCAGFIALGMCIGLLIGLAQVILKEAWLKVEKGFRAGREMILSKPLLTIGRAESCDVGLFGDPAVEKLHARILQRGNLYFVEDANTPAGTLVNGQRISAPTLLHSGDLIQVGRNTLSFGERAKRS